MSKPNPDDEVHQVESVFLTFKGGLTPDGKVTRVNIRQYHALVQLTIEQARSLARTIIAKLGD